MKKYLFSLIFLLVSYVGFSQKGLSYQAVILDPAKIEIPGQDISGQPLVNGDVWLKFSIFNGSSLQFEEVQKTKTDNYGLVNLLIGSEASTSFNALVWNSSQKSLQVFVSFNQGATYTKVSDQKLNYNPYALYAETAGKLSGVLSIENGGTGATTAVGARANLGLDQVNNTSDVAKPISTATQTALNLKANAADVTAGLALKANVSDVNSSLALKANESDMSAALAAKADTGTIKTFVVNQVAAATIPDADATIKGKIKLAGDLGGTADAPTVPGLALKANSANVTSALALKADVANVSTSLNLKENAANKSVNVYTDGASDTKYPSVKAIKNYVDAQVVAGVSASTIADADATTKGKVQLAGDLGGTADAPTVPGLTFKASAADLATLTTTVISNTASISSETTRATAAELSLANNLSANTASITTNTSDLATLNSSVASNTASITANTAAINLKAPIISPTFTGTVTTGQINTGAISASSVTAPAYSSTPITLTYSGSTINWDPSQGLNAEIVLTSNSSISFLTIPPVGSYGTVVLTQDGTGGRTIVLPSISGVTNKVLGSTSTSTIALSTAANSKDILNFYYDGTNCYWNIGQGYGAATISAATNLATNVTGTLPIANGGTGATTLTGLIKGNGTNALTAATAGTDYQAPITLTTTGSGSATLSGTTLNIPTSSSYSLTTASSSTLGGIKVGNNLSIDGSGVLSANINSGSISGTVAVASGGTGATTSNTAFNALAPTQTSNSGKYLTTDGTNTSWGTVASTLPTTVNDGANYNIVMATYANAALVTGTGNGGNQATLNPYTGKMSVSGLTAQGYGITSPMYASTPQTLTDGAIISWNPLNGLNASILLGGNRTLSFSGTLLAGSYGTLVVTQDATGGRTLTLPSVTNKILSSTSTTTISLSTAPNAKDIIKFYFDGSTYFWNVSQGYGLAATDAAPLVSPTFTGTPSAPTATSGTNTTQIATTAFVANALSANTLSGYSSSVNGVYNVGLGYNTASNAIGSFNTSIGTLAMTNVTSGTDNVIIGAQAARYINPAVSGTWTANNQSMNRSVIIGSASRVSNINSTNEIVIGYDAIGSGSNTIQLGNSLISNLKTAGTISSGDVTYPKTHGSSGQVLSTTGSGTLGWTTPITTLTTTGTGAATLSGTTLNIPTPSSGGGGTHVLGEQFGGGTVFYINSDGTHGLIAENADLGTSRPFTVDGVNSNGTMWMVGARYQSRNPLAHTTAGKEFFDWEIPEIYELHYLYQAINSSNSVFDALKLSLGSKSYWSNSFEQSYTQSYMIQFSNGAVANMGDRQLYNVRCIRRF